MCLEELWKDKANNPITDVAISRDGKYAVAGSRDFYVYFFDIDRKQLWKYETKGCVKCVAISSDGKYAFAGSRDYYVYFFERSDDDHWSCINKHRAGNPITDLAITCDGKYMVAGSRDFCVYLFDSSGNLLCEYETGGAVKSVAISDYGKYVIAGSFNKEVYFMKFERKPDLYLNTENMASIVRQRVLKVIDPDDGAISTAFLIGTEGYALTCYHVIHPCHRNKPHEMVKVQHQQQCYQAEVILGYSDPDKDIAVLKIVDDAFTDFLRQLSPLYLSPHWDPGDPVMAVGIHRQYRINETEAIYGHIEKYNPIQEVTFIENTSNGGVIPIRQNCLIIVFDEYPWEQGLSGAPVLNTRTGRVIAIANGVRDPHAYYPSRGYAIPIEDFQNLTFRILESIRKLRSYIECST